MINSKSTRSHLCAAVWATRPLKQNSSWCQRLESAGWSVVARPLLSIHRVSDSGAQAAIKNIVLGLDNYEILIFVSQNAVECGFDWIHNYWPELPVKQHYLAVGSKTEKSLRVHVNHVAPPGEAMDSDALLALPECHGVAGKRIVIFRGRGGLPRLGQVLTERGATVHYCELYDRVYPHLEPEQADHWSRRLLEDTLVIPVFSGESLLNLERFLREVKSFSSSQFDERVPYSNSILVVPGERVANLAKATGFSRVVTAKNASEEAMFATVNALHLVRANSKSTPNPKGEMND